MTFEKRNLKRRKLIYYLPVTDIAAGQGLGRLVDITIEGMMLVSTRPIPVGGRYRLKMDPSLNVGGENGLIFEAQSLWSKPDVNPEFFATGFRFVRMAPENARAVEDMIDRLELPE